MINLLPPRLGLNIRYGRHNATLRRWLVAVGLANAGLLIIILFGGLYINRQSANLSRSLSFTQQQLKAQKLSEVQKSSQDITNNVKIINQVLSREIRFSDLIQEVGKVMPAGTILDGLTLNKVNGALDMSASTKDYVSATQIAVNLSDPKNNLFAKVDIININCATSAQAYPCSGSFKALFNKTTQSRFLNVPKGSTP